MNVNENTLLEIANYLINEFDCDKCRYNEACDEYIKKNGIEFCQLITKQLGITHDKLKLITKVIDGSMD